MTTQEQQMLQDLTDRINNTQLAEKDPEAERYLQDTLGRNPDALYILAQTMLVQGYALEQAQKQLADLRTQAAQPKRTTSFLGNLLGHNDEPAPPPPPPASYQQQPQYQPVPNYPPQQAYYPPPPQYAAPQPGYGYGAPPQQGGGFLRSAMTTATGVAAGALAFEGIETLMHGFGGNHGGGYGFEGGGAPREEIVNNYYGDSSPQHEQHSSDLGSDIEDRRNDFADTGNNDNFADDNSNDFGSSDDSGSIDDSSL